MKTIADEQLRPFGETTGALNCRLRAFIHQQRTTWPALAAAHRELSESISRPLRLSDSDIRLQYNPRRTRSTTAKVSPAEIAQRPCFLCPENLYPEQLGLDFASGWLILNNPFPIFTDHLVVSSTRHTAQLLDQALPAMVKFVDSLDGAFSAFYNGARCGASAPDHLHFQACPAGMLPLEQQLATLLHKPLHSQTPWSFFTRDNRGIGLCRAAAATELLGHLNTMCAHLNRTAAPGNEADVNVIIFGKPGNLAGVFMPRSAHRPACFFASDDAQYIISPGAVDVAGLVILPRRKDYERMNAETMLSIYREVCLPADAMTATGLTAKVQKPVD